MLEYPIRKLFCATSLALMVLFITGCSKGRSPKEETPGITEAITTYVRDVKKINVEAMTTTVENIVIKGETASCTAKFALKGESAPAMAYKYELKKTAGKWAVVSSGADASSPHGAPPTEGQMPPGHPAISGGSPHGDSMPAVPAHEATPGAAPQQQEKPAGTPLPPKGK